MRFLVALVMFLHSGSFAVAGEKSLPPFFTYLRAVDNTILQEMRYFGVHNFLGRKVKGYEAAECILTKRAALALKSVQKRLVKRGLSLKVYDCYRPARAVKDFVTWSQNNDKKAKPEFYPTLPKRRLFALGYIARRSAHSRGSTVDLAIVPLPPEKQPDFSFERQRACFESYEKRFADNSLDFGTGYDCFHELSHTRNPNIGEIARRNRQLLVSEMARAGFVNYSKEWWHFTLRNEPYRKKYFDFPITAYQGGATRVLKEKAVDEQDIKTEPLKEEKKSDLDVEKLIKMVPLRVVCVAEDDVLNVRAGPNSKADLVARLPPNAVGIHYKGCLGDVSVERWHSVSPKMRKTMITPWCEILAYRLPSSPDEITVKGWVSGAFVVPEGAMPRPCRF